MTHLSFATSRRILTGIDVRWRVFPLHDATSLVANASGAGTRYRNNSGLLVATFTINSPNRVFAQANQDLVKRAASS